MKVNNILFYNGLSSKEAEKKLRDSGLNVIEEKKKISAAVILLRQFSDYMVLILLACTAVSAYMGDMTEAFSIIAIVLLNSILGFTQEYRTEKTMEALKGLSAPVARVVRNGEKQVIPAENVVPGDLILLEAGDRVPADAHIIAMNRLQADESLLTGESVPVDKEAAKVGPDGKIVAAGKSSVYLGTTITSGNAKALVYATGMDTEMGKIAELIQTAEEEETPLQKRLARLGKTIAAACLVICAAVSLTGILRGEELLSMLLAGISLAVAAVPEGLPAIVTVALALGVRRMLKRNALVRRLPAVETLGSATVICSDKTGTLTENKMTLRKLYTGFGLYGFKDGKFFKELKDDKLHKELKNGRSHKADNAVGFRQDNNGLMKQSEQLLKRSLEIGAICNNASVANTNGAVTGFKGAGARIIGDPTEAALVSAALGFGLSKEKLDKEYVRISEIPFDPDRKRMSVICRSRGGELYVFVKGAPDIIINKCSRILSEDGVLSMEPKLKGAVLKANDEMAGDALRVLGLAYKKIDASRAGKKDLENSEEMESDLIFAGLAGIIDPPRREAAESVRKCRLAGIKPVMITGDHKLTAAAVAREVGILDEGDKVLTGSDLDKMSDKRLEAAVNDISVYARVTPGHKLRIVRALKRNGHVVAMTGDGVNDAPAVKEADIGVSMGISGTDVTKEASSMVLLDDNFSTIVAAVEEGRMIFNNIRKFIRYMLSCNTGEVLNMFLGMILGLPVPLLPIQILLVNLVTDGLPAMALSMDPSEKEVMYSPPRKARESIFSQGLFSMILTRGIIIGLSTLAVFMLLLSAAGDIAAARTGALATLVCCQLIHVFECKSEKRNLFHIPILNNPYLIAAVSCSLLTLISVIYVPALQAIFKTVPLSLNQWLMVCGFSFIGPVAAAAGSGSQARLRKAGRRF